MQGGSAQTHEDPLRHCAQCPPDPPHRTGRKVGVIPRRGRFTPLHLEASLCMGWRPLGTENSHRLWLRKQLACPSGGGLWAWLR